MSSSQSKTINVLIPEGDTPFTLFVINSLSHFKHIKLHIASNSNHIEARYSRNISSFTHFGNLNEELYLTFLQEQIREKKVKILLPLHFESISFVAKNKKKFEILGIKCIVSSLESLKTANNKWKFYSFLTENNFPVPKTDYFPSIDSVKGLNYPYIIKPLSGWNGGNIKWISKASDLNSLQDCSKQKNPIIAQQYVGGDDYCLNVICLEGKLLAYTMQKGILANSNRFQSHLGLRFMYNESIYQTIKEVVARLNWSGVANFDLRYQPNDNKFYIIEMNPRFWGLVEASERVGVNFSYLMCLLSLNKSFDRPEFKKENYISNRGILKLMQKAFTLKRSGSIAIDNHSLSYDLKDPVPKIVKYYTKALIIFSLKKYTHKKYKKGVS